MKYIELSIAKITVPGNHRRVKPAAVAALASSIHDIGLQHPIAVTVKHRLIHGRHRLEAYSLMNRTVIPAFIHDLDELHAELAEIDENLYRNQLTALQYSQALARRKEIYEVLHPEAKRGAQGGGKKGKGTRRKTESDTMSFSDDTAATTGKSKRSVERDVAIAKSIPDDVQEVIADTPIADNKSELAKLSKLPEEDQRDAARQIASGEAITVDDAIGSGDGEEEGLEAIDGTPTEIAKAENRLTTGIQELVTKCWKSPGGFEVDVPGILRESANEYEGDG